MTRTKLDISPDGEAVTILIDNQWRAAAGGGAVAVHAPSDDGAFAQIARGGAAEVDEAVAAARHAFEEGEWGRLTAIERGRLLMRV
ncbi:aldehyde dehydrogenase family protein, partial [Arhodomonas sp. KWT]